MNRKGGCICGTARYEVDWPDAPIGRCACAVCRDGNIAGMMLTLGVALERFHWTAGEADLDSYRDSTGSVRRFCSNCGTHLIDERVSLQRVTVRLATLDDEFAEETTAHEWTQFHARPDNPENLS